MRRMCVRICQQLFAQSLFFQEGHQLCIGIPFHSGTIRRRCNAHTAGQIPHHAKRPDFTVKRFLLPHGAAGIRQHRAKKQFLSLQGRRSKGLLCSGRCQFRRNAHFLHGFHRFRRKHRKFPGIRTVKSAAKPTGRTSIRREYFSQHNA